jgi:hypothetical protein
MNWRCDVYVYEDCAGGWTTHVAGRRRPIQPIPDLPLHKLPRFGGKWCKEARRVVYPDRIRALCAKLVFRFAAFWHNKVHMKSLDLIPLRPIGLPHDGQHFSSDTAGECAELLLMLRGIGYTVPDYAIEALQEEASQPPDAGEGREGEDE